MVHVINSVIINYVNYQNSNLYITGGGMHFFMKYTLKRKLLLDQRTEKFLFLEAWKCFFLHFLGEVL